MGQGITNEELLKDISGKKANSVQQILKIKKCLDTEFYKTFLKELGEDCGIKDFEEFTKILEHEKSGKQKGNEELEM